MSLVQKQTILLLVIGLLLSGAAGYVIAINSISPQLEEARSDASSLRYQLSQLRMASEVSLPGEVEQLSPVLPMMGAHWADPSDLPLGPIYLLTDDGKIMGIEYKFTENMLEEVLVPGSEEGILELNGLSISMPEIGLERVAEYMDLSYMPRGHDGFDEHWDLHIYFVSPEELARLTGEIDLPIQVRPWGNAPDFTLIDLDGNPFKLSDFGGRVILLDFMATWCGPCRSSMPGLVALHEEVGEEVVMISIGVDPVYDNEERLREWVNEWGAEWIHVRDLADPPLMQLYGVTGIPTYVIVDKNGDIRFRHVGLTSGAMLMAEFLYLSE